MVLMTAKKFGKFWSRTGKNGFKRIFIQIEKKCCRRSKKYGKHACNVIISVRDIFPLSTYSGRTNNIYKVS